MYQFLFGNKFSYIVNWESIIASRKQLTLILLIKLRITYDNTLTFPQFEKCRGQMVVNVKCVCVKIRFGNKKEFLSFHHSLANNSIGAHLAVFILSLDVYSDNLWVTINKNNSICYCGSSYEKIECNYIVLPIFSAAPLCRTEVQSLTD